MSQSTVKIFTTTMYACIDVYLLSTDGQVKVAGSAHKGGDCEGGGVGGQRGDAGGGHPVHKEPPGPCLLILAGVQGRAGVQQVAAAQRGLLTKTCLFITTAILIWPNCPCRCVLPGQC